MHAVRLSLVLLALLPAVAARAAEEPEQPASPPDETVMIANLQANRDGIFQYGSWDQKIAHRQSGLAVLGSKGAQGKGGFGRNMAKTLDLSQVSQLEVALGVVPSNEVPQVTVAVNDADGTQFSARIAIDQLVAGSPVWLRAKRTDFKLNGTERGSDGKMDWTQVKSWHLQGDWNTEKPMAVIFVALRARK